MAGPLLLMFMGGLLVVQTIWGAMFERLGIKATLTGGS